MHFGPVSRSFIQNKIGEKSQSTLWLFETSPLPLCFMFRVFRALAPQDQIA